MGTRVTRHDLGLQGTERANGIEERKKSRRGKIKKRKKKKETKNCINFLHNKKKTAFPPELFPKILSHSAVPSSAPTAL